MSRNPDCQLCDLHKNCSHVCLWGEGGNKPIVMVVGEAPGAEEDKVGRPFIGRSGKLLRRLVSGLGLEGSQVYITNAVKCRPELNRTPGKRHLQACRPFLLEEIKKLKPQFIVMLGQSAIKSVTGQEKVTVSQLRGLRNWYYPETKSKLIATYHPAAILRNPKLSDDLIDDLNRIALDDFVPEEKISWQFVEKVTKLPQTLAFDLETTGLNPWGPGEILSIAWSAFPNRSYVTKDVAGFIRHAKDKCLIGHNVKFDLLWLYAKSGVMLPATEDTKLMAHLLDENGSTSLKYLGGQLTGYGDWGSEVKAQVYAGRGNEVPVEKLYEYNAYDAAATLRLYRELQAPLRKQGLEKLYRAHMKTVNTLCAVEAQGFLVDPRDLTIVKIGVDKRIKELEKTILRSVGSYGSIENLSSTQQLSRLLFDTLKLRPTRKTPKGLPSVDEASLRALQGQVPDRAYMTPVRFKNFLTNLLEYRAQKKIKSTYLEAVEKILDVTGDNVVRPSYNLTGTATGRLSCAAPNMQNIPRESHSPVKQVYISPKNSLFVQADYSQIELRIGAFVTGDKNMLSVIREGVDLHDETARKIFGGKFTKEERVFAKTINFGVFYGMGPYALSDMLGITKTAAKEYLQEWYSHYPGVKEWQGQQKQSLQDHGYVTNLLGRRRRLPAVFHGDRAEYAEAVRKACNFPVQSLAAEVTLFGMNALREDGHTLFGNVHDSILLLLPVAGAELLLPEIKSVLENTTALFQKAGFDIEIDVPTPVDIQTGYRWGALQDWEA